MPLARIKRFGNQFASCGVPVRPPEHLVGRSGIKRLCPKLVPGQVIDLPEDHTLFNQEAIEIVRRVAPDEILRPWVFSSADAAVMANPSKRRLSHDQIMGGLAMADGALQNADRHREAMRKRKAKEAAMEDEPDDGEEIELEPEERIVKRSQNREAAEVYEDAKAVSDEDDGEEDPAPRSGGRRKPDAERSVRRTRAVKRGDR